ncbi:MAG TPA: endo-1,4-beta-xylanase [Povalibacter sp.]
MRCLTRIPGRLQRLLLTIPFLLPVAAHAQTEPVIVEAETGTLGGEFSIGTLGTDTYITIGSTIGGNSPPNAARITRYAVTFPSAGRYELYARFYVGPQSGNDDSWFSPRGFGLKQPAVDADWVNMNPVDNIGYTAPQDTVRNAGPARNLVFKWIKVTGFAGAPVFVVPDGALKQDFSFAGREDGMFMDKFAFGHEGSYYTVNDLNTGGPATGSPPPPPPPPYEPPGPPMATGKDKFLGSAYNTDAQNRNRNFAKYFNQVTPENGGKWGPVEGTRDVMNWTEADAAHQLAKDNGFLFKWHTLVWGNQQPGWIESLPPEEQLEEIKEWMAAIAERYGDDISQIDVVNEPTHDPPDNTSPGNGPGGGAGNYIKALGGANDLYGTGWDWVIRSFELARQYFPHAKLILNDYSVTNEPDRTTTYLQIIKLLQDRGLIDGIGDQGHAFSNTGPVSTIQTNLDRLAVTGLPIYITEFDLDGNDDPVQLANYQRVFPVFWEHPAVQGITLWGYTTAHWRFGSGDWLVYDNGAERPAMQWLVKYVSNNLPQVTSGQSFAVAENAADGTVIGTVTASDVDSGQTLSGWQIDGGSGASIFAIDAASGALSVVNAAALDFETATSYALSVSVYDGYRRSTPVNVAVNVTNANDNAPVITAAQKFDVDGGVRNVLGNIRASDADDTNQSGFTKLQNWKIVGGTGASLFTVNASTGTLIAARPTAIDFRKSSYTVVTRVGDGTNTSEPQTVTVNIPNQIDLCVLVVEVQVPKHLASLALKLGASLGDCRAR